MRHLVFLASLLGLAIVGGGISLAQECPTVSRDIAERATSFFTSDTWERERTEENVTDVRPSDLTPVKDPETGALITDNTSPLPKDYYAEAFFRLPDGRFVVYTYIEGKSKKVDEDTYSIRTGFSSIEIYSSEMKKLAGALL